jgi:hypothetical protein
MTIENPKRHAEYIAQLPEMPSNAVNPHDWHFLYMPGSAVVYPVGQPKKNLKSGVKETGTQVRALGA